MKKLQENYYQLVQEEKNIGEQLDLLRKKMEYTETVEEDYKLLRKQKQEYRKLVNELFEVGDEIDEMEKKR